MQRLVYEGRLAMLGPTSVQVLYAAMNYSMVLQTIGRSAEAASFLRERISEATSALAENHPVVVDLRVALANALIAPATTTGVRLCDLQEAVEIYEKTVRFFRRTLGPEHPKTKSLMQLLAGAQILVARSKTS